MPADKSEDWVVPQKKDLYFYGLEPGDLLYFTPLKMSVSSIRATRLRNLPNPLAIGDIVTMPLYHTPRNHYGAAVMFLGRGTLSGSRREYVKVLKGEEILQVPLNDLGFLWGIRKAER